MPIEPNEPRSITIMMSCMQLQLAPTCTDAAGPAYGLRPMGVARSITKVSHCTTGRRKKENPAYTVGKRDSSPHYPGRTPKTRRPHFNRRRAAAQHERTRGFFTAAYDGCQAGARSARTVRFDTHAPRPTLARPFRLRIPTRGLRTCPCRCRTRGEGGRSISCCPGAAPALLSPSLKGP
jgi:hypothetical protein